MKITIEYDDITSSVEFGEFDLNEFTDRLRGLLYTIWLPSQVDDIIPNEETLSDENEEFTKENQEYYESGYDHGRKLGYARGHREGYKAAVAAMQETYEPMLKETAKDSERLGWLLERAYTIQLREGDILTSREDIDKEMEESK